jgi:hypothetical protein
MATVVGEVSNVTGTVVAIDASGNERILNVGDQVFAGETIRTGEGAFVAIALVDGGRFDLGRNGEAILDSDVVDVDGDQGAPAADEGALSVESIQAAIAAGVDPTQLLPATAAGPAAGSNGVGPDGAGHSFVIVDPGLTEVLPPVPDFVTQGFGVDFAELPGTREDFPDVAEDTPSEDTPSEDTPSEDTAEDTTEDTEDTDGEDTSEDTAEDTTGKDISNVNFYVVDENGDLTDVVKVDYVGNTWDTGDYDQPQLLAEALVTDPESDYFGDIIMGYSIKAGNDFYHYAKDADSGDWELVAYSLTTGGQGAKSETEYFVLGEEGYEEVNSGEYQIAMNDLFPAGSTPETFNDMSDELVGSNDLFDGIPAEVPEDTATAGEVGDEFVDGTDPS